MLTQSRSSVGITHVSGEAILPFADICAPSKEVTRETLICLRRSLGLSRGHMASLLGVRKDHLRRWEKGSRRPCRSAQKLIWLIDSMAHNSENLKDSISIITWGKSWELGNTRDQEPKALKESNESKKKSALKRSSVHAPKITRSNWT